MGGSILGKNVKGLQHCHPKDRYGVWEKHANKGGSGKIMLIDRDGTILSTSNDAQELEPLIKAAIERGK
jgi:hypothetical protein